MSPHSRPTRRQFLATTTTVTAAGFAGCSASDGDASGSKTTPEGFDARNEPTRLWATDDSDVEPVGPLTATADRVFVPARDEFLALNAASGAVEWRLDAGDDPSVFWGQSTVVDGTVYVPGLDDRVRAVDATSGELVWERTLDSGVVAAPTTSAYGATVGTLDGVVIGTLDGVVHALDRETGESNWRVEVFGGVRAGIAAGQTELYVPTTAGELVALAHDGVGRWRRRLGGQLRSPPVVTDVRVFVGSWDETLYALDLQSGETDWTATVGTFEWENGVAVADGTVCYTAGRDVGVLDGDGSERWSVSLPDNVDCRPSLVGDTLLAGGQDRLHAFDPAGASGFGPLGSDQTRWTRDTNDDVGPGIAVTDSRLFVPYRGGRNGVVAFEPQ